MCVCVCVCETTRSTTDRQRPGPRPGRDSRGPRLCVFLVAFFTFCISFEMFAAADLFVIVALFPPPVCMFYFLRLFEHQVLLCQIDS